MPSRGMRRLSEQETDPNLADSLTNSFERQINSNSKRLQHVRAAALRTRRAVSVLRHSCACRSRNNRRRRRNIKSSGIVPASSARIHHPLRQSLAIRKNPRRMPPHRPRKPRQLLRPKRSFIQRAKQLHNLRRPQPPAQQLLHNLFRLRSTKQMPANRLVQHTVSHAFSTSLDEAPGQHINLGLPTVGVRLDSEMTSNAQSCNEHETEYSNNRPTVPPKWSAKRDGVFALEHPVVCSWDQRIKVDRKTD